MSFKWPHEQRWKTFYLVSERSYSSLTGRPEAEPILEHNLDENRPVFIEKWWYAAEKVPSYTISSWAHLKRAMAFKRTDRDFIFDSYHIEVQDTYHGVEGAVRKTISTEEFSEYVERLPRISTCRKTWNRVVWFHPDQWWDEDGFAWKTNGNGSSPHRVQGDQLGTRVLRCTARTVSWLQAPLNAFGWSLMFSSEWHEPTTSMLHYNGKKSETHTRVAQVGRLGLYRVRETEPGRLI